MNPHMSFWYLERKPIGLDTLTMLARGSRYELAIQQDTPIGLE